MATLFEEAKIKDLVLRNRTIRSATYEGMADREGHVTDRMINLYRERRPAAPPLFSPAPSTPNPADRRISARFPLSTTPAARDSLIL